MKNKSIYSGAFFSLKLASIFLAAMLYCTVGKAQSNGRSTVNFNREWKFKLGDVRGAEASSFNDTQWESVGIPHSFSMPYFMSNDFYIGYGWYRKQFIADASIKSKKHI